MIHMKVIVHQEAKAVCDTKEMTSKPLIELAKTFAGGTPSRSIQEFFNGAIPWVKSTEVNFPYIEDTEEYISERAVIASSAKWVNKGSVLVAMYGATAGQVSELRINATTNQAVLAIDSIGEVSNRYLYYYLANIKNKLLYVAQGSGQPNLSKSLVDKLIVRYPSVIKQKKIIKILSTIDQTIEKTEALIYKYRQIKAGLMHDLFTRGLTADGKLRSPREQAPDLYQETPIGWIPKEWIVEPAKNIIVNIKRGPSLATNLKESGIRYLTSDNIRNDGELDWTIIKHLDVPQHSLTSILEIDDVILNCVNSEGQIGKVGFIYELPELTTVGFNNFAIKFDDTFVSPRFCFYLLSDQRFQKSLRQKIKPAINQVSFSASDLNRIICAYPKNKSEQDKIVAILDGETKYLGSELLMQKKFMKIKSGLMHDLLTGRVRVKVNESKNQEAAA